MIRQYYIIKDSDDKEVNFYDSKFPNAKNRAIMSAKQVPNSIVIFRKTDTASNTKEDVVIWPE